MMATSLILIIVLMEMVGDGCTADDHGAGESGNADGGHASFGCAWVARP